jgi:crossover junction endodeoxyribonuclease RuvC
MWLQTSTYLLKRWKLPVEVGRSSSLLAIRDHQMRVIGVDPGSETTGYGVIESDGRRYQLVEFSCIRSPRGLNFAGRLLAISTKLEEVIERLNPEACAVEDTFYAVNVKSALKLGQARGAVLVAAARAGVEVFEYSPLEVKSALVGYGRAEKQQVQEMVRVLLGLNAAPEPLDASDALAIAICHANTSSTKGRLTAKR